MALGGLERLHHVVHDLGAGQDIALSGDVGADAVTRPVRRLRPRVRRHIALGVHHGELPAQLRPVVRVRIWIVVENPLHDLHRRKPLP